MINNSVHGYTQLMIDDEKLDSITDSMVNVIVDKSADDKLALYYRKFRKILSNRNRIYLIGVKDDNTSLKVLSSLMLCYNDYDVYEVNSKDRITASYIKNIEERNPDITEVETYINGEISCYTELSELVFGIENLAKEKNIDALSEFVENHVGSVENIVGTVNKLKKRADLFNSDEMFGIIKKSREAVDKLNTTIEEKDKKLEEIKYERDKFKVDADTLRRENGKLKTTNEQLEQVGANGGAIIKSYKTLNTQLIRCKTKQIIYFKELSYVPYVNSTIDAMMKLADMKGLKCKLIVYDDAAATCGKYTPLMIVNGSNYENNRTALINKIKSFVVTEATMNVLNEVVTSEQCFDLVIVYDRMKQTDDIISGNNVTKIFVINSSKDYNANKSLFKINHLESIIAPTASSIGVERDNEQRKFLDIPKIDNYINSTDVAKTSLIFKSKCSYHEHSIIKEIARKANIEQLS